MSLKRGERIDRFQVRVANAIKQNINTSSSLSYTVYLCITCISIFNVLTIEGLEESSQCQSHLRISQTLLIVNICCRELHY
jgi:hypothetical protein